MTGIRPSLIAASRRRFNPLSLSPALWLSDTGSSAGTWPDLSGNGRDATQADSAKQPAIITNALNGRQVRRFDGTDDFMGLSSGLNMMRNVAGATIILVTKWAASPSANRRIFAISTNSTSTARLSINGGLAANKNYFGGRRLDDDSFERVDSANDSPLDFFIMSGVASWQSRTLRLFHNGALEGASDSFQSGGNTSDTNSGSIQVGQLGTSPTAFANCDIAEILVFPTALSTADRQRVESFLSQKYNIALA